MNGILWRIKIVPSKSYTLIDRTGKRTVATTDPAHKNVYLSEKLQGDFLMTVFIHELGHCALYSFNLLEEIHRMTYPEYWVEMEEFICNFLADFGFQIFKVAFSTMGYNAWKLIPLAFEKKLA